MYFDEVLSRLTTSGSNLGGRTYQPLLMTPPKDSVLKSTKWVWVNSHGVYPANMVQGGQDSDGCAIYAGRASHAGDLLPAKVIPQKNAAYIAYGGEEIFVANFEVLCQKELVWENATGGNIPPDAIIGGNTADGEVLYVGRAFHEGSQTVGKVQRSHGCVYLPYGGAEVAVQEYEVLCER